MQNIMDGIQDALAAIEKQKHVKILYAVESGSRAWGVESPDSDYDVRFIYVHPKEEYLKLQPVRDVIEWQLDDVLDINGWDLRKALQHFYKGNATLHEWCNSPIVYKCTPEWVEISQIGCSYFSEKASMYHYYGTAKSTYENYLLQDDVKYKKYVYALRPLLACRYIENYHQIPPVLFDELKEKMLPESIAQSVEAMLEIKKGSDEKDLLPQIPEIKSFIDNEILRIATIMKTKTDDCERQWEPLDKLFIRILN